ncbi:MAG TPA: NYN domain-containing protein [Candidatus Hydrogenedentes bacterium]|nr:NYN domain-containing protein [Candidatus Hydrogenedentota bacterium]
MPALYLIDGYNLIHHCPQLQRLAHSDFEAARDDLIERVSRFSGTTNEPAKIVFDGRGRAEQPHKPFRGAPGLEVVYSPGHLTADAVIERHVYNAPHRRDIVVVTGDRGIRDLCRGLGSLVMSPEHFLTIVEEALTRSTAHMRATYERFSTNMLEDRLPEKAREHLKHIKDNLDKKKS